MSSPLKIIQVGVGSWGWSWIDVVQRSAHWELAALVVRNAQTRDKVIEHFQINPGICFETLGEAAQQVQADAVLVVVPPEDHASIVMEALKHGLHCMIEKPLAPTIEEALAIVEAGEKAGKKVMVSQNFRYKRAPQTVKSVLKRNLIGEIGSVYINFQKAPPFTGFRTEMDEPLITDLAIHHFDQIRGILGLEPVKIMAHSWNPKWSWFKGNAVASVLFEMENGAVVQYTGSWVSRGWETTWDGDWRIQGDGGEVYWSDNKVTIKVSDIFQSVFLEGALESNGLLEVGLLNMPFEERLATLAEFANAIHEDREPEMSGRDNLKSIAMVLGAKLSIESGKPVLISELLKARS